MSGVAPSTSRYQAIASRAPSTAMYGVSAVTSSGTQGVVVVASVVRVMARPPVVDVDVVEVAVDGSSRPRAATMRRRRAGSDRRDRQGQVVERIVRHQSTSSP